MVFRFDPTGPVQFNGHLIQVSIQPKRGIKNGKTK